MLRHIDLGDAMTVPIPVTLLQAAVGSFSDTRRFAVAHTGIDHAHFALFGGAPGFEGHVRLAAGGSFEIDGCVLTLIETATEPETGRPCVHLALGLPMGDDD